MKCIYHRFSGNDLCVPKTTELKINKIIHLEYDRNAQSFILVDIFGHAVNKGLKKGTFLENKVYFLPNIHSLIRMVTFQEEHPVLRRLPQ